MIQPTPGSIAADLMADQAPPVAKARPRSNGNGSTVRPFEMVNAIDTIEVLDRLGIDHEKVGEKELATCPGCGEPGALVCKDGGCKCLHNRCSDAGPTSAPGFRSNVDIIMVTLGTDESGALAWSAERFGTPPPVRRDCATPEDPGDPDPDYVPTDSGEEIPSSERRVRVETAGGKFVPTTDDGAPLVRLGDCAADALAMVERRRSGEESPIPLPWSDLSYALGGGTWPGLHMLLSGTGRGKTQYEIQRTDCAATAGVPVVLVTLELNREDLLIRMASARCGVRWSELVTGRASLETIAAVRRAADSLATLPIYVEQGDPGEWTAAHMRSLCHRLRREHPTGPGLVIVDYLQLCGGEQRELRERVGATAYAGRAMARERGLAVELVSSVARDKYALLASAVETAGLGFGDAPGTAGKVRIVKNPDALIGVGKESGEIEFAADSQTVLVRWPGPLDDGRTLTLAVVPKVRLGPASWCALAFDGGRFVSYPVRSQDDLPEVERKSGRPKVADDEIRERVIATVRRCAGLKSARQVEERTDGARERVRSALKACLTDGSIKETEAGYAVA